MNKVNTDDFIHMMFPGNRKHICQCDVIEWQRSWMESNNAPDYASENKTDL